MSEIKDTLPIGLKVGDQIYREFVMREALAGDMFAAEAEAPPERGFTFRCALAGQQLVSLGELSGPISLETLGKLKGKDINALLNAQDKLADEGKDEPST